MKTLCLAALAVITSLLPRVASAGVPGAPYFVIFRATAKIPLLVEGDDGFGKFLKKTIRTNDLVNLALGRKLGTKVDPDKEILAAAVYFEEPGEPPVSKLIVYDKTAAGAARIVTDVAALTSIDFVRSNQTARTTGVGFGTASFVTSNKNDFAKFGLVASQFTGSAVGSTPHSDFTTGFQSAKSMAGTAAIQGRLKFNTTDDSNVTTVFNGLFNHGVLIVASKRLDVIEND